MVFTAAERTAFRNVLTSDIILLFLKDFGPRKLFPKDTKFDNAIF